MKEGEAVANEVAPVRAKSVSRKPARAVVVDAASNEVVFAVVGYVGSGTSEIAKALKGLLEQEKLDGGNRR
jgi:energy-coupling factor transporter ATP-binding protein EcfA2